MTARNLWPAIIIKTTLMVLLLVSGYLFFEKREYRDIFSGEYNVFSQLSRFEQPHQISASENQQGFLVYGPYVPLAPGSYTVKFMARLRNQPASPPDKKIFSCDVYFNDIQSYNKGKEITQSDFQGRHNLTVPLRFDVPAGNPKAEFRVFLFGGNSLTLTGIYLRQHSRVRTVALLFKTLLAVVLCWLIGQALWRVGKRYWQEPGVLSQSGKSALTAAIVVIGFSLSVFYHYYQHYYLQLGYPFSTFLFNPVSRFTDFYDVCRVSEYLNPYYTENGMFGNYFPFTYILAYLFARFPTAVSFPVFNLILVFGCLSLVCLAVREKTRHDWLSEKITQTQQIFILTFLTYPFLFLLDRGNFETLVFVFLFLFLFIFTRKKYLLSAVFLALAAALKGYPLVFAALYLTEKRYREGLLAVFLFLLLSLASFSVMQGGLVRNYQGFVNGLALFKQNYVLGAYGVETVRHNTSLFVLVRLLKGDGLWLNRFMSYYFWGCAAAFIPILLYVKKNKEIWKNTALLALAVIVLPYISYDYKLIHVLLPLGLYIQAETRRPGDIGYGLILALLLIPKDYMMISDWGSIAVIINPLLMIMMMAALLGEALLVYGKKLNNARVKV